MPAKRTMYIEQKTADRGRRPLDDQGPAMIADVTFSKTGRTVYADGKTFKKYAGIYGNYPCGEDGNEYWISGVKKRGSNRLYGNAPVVDKTAAPSDQAKTVERNLHRENAPRNPVVPRVVRAESCAAGRRLFEWLGWQQAASFLIGDEFLSFLGRAQSDPQFQAEVPAFVAEIRTIFEPWQIEVYFDKAMHRGIGDLTLLRQAKRSFCEASL